MSESARITAIEPPATFRSFAAPRTHGSLLVDPPLADAGRLIDENRKLASGWEIEFGGVSLLDLRTSARDEVLRAAGQYVRSYAGSEREGRWPDISESEWSKKALVMSGHQPTLFHPGVWYKNFALSEVAIQQQAVALNLVVDNDLAGAAAVRCPVLGRSGETGMRLSNDSVPYDGPSGMAVPYEQRWIADAELFQSFPKRLKKSLTGVVDDPLVDRLWPHALAASRRCSNLGCALAQGRHALESELGLKTLELPISSACKLLGFSRFVLGILNELSRFQACYNESLREYRTAHRIRSTAHPVPALGEQDEWLEAPLWIYGDDDGRRRSAWVRRLGDGLELSDRAGRAIRIERSEGSSAAEQLNAAQKANFKLRPRALVTTMFARLVLSDLFLHGIGGAKYDQLGDRIIARFFGIEAPKYCVISATVLLPGWEQASERLEQESSVAQLLRRLRDIRFSPELFAGYEPLPEALLERKRALLAWIPPRGSKRDWHREMQQVNSELAGHLGSVAAAIRVELTRSAERTRELQIWRSREHAFPIFPLDYLRRSLGV